VDLYCGVGFFGSKRRRRVSFVWVESTRSHQWRAERRARSADERRNFIHGHGRSCLPKLVSIFPGSAAVLIDPSPGLSAAVLHVTGTRPGAVIYVPVPPGERGQLYLNLLCSTVSLNGACATAGHVPATAHVEGWRTCATAGVN